MYDHPLLQDADNATLQSETLPETVCDAIIANGGVKNPSKNAQNVCDDGCIKHGPDFSCVCDPGHTIDPFELFVMRQNNKNGQPDQCVCDIRHTVHSDELFAIRECNRNG